MVYWPSLKKNVRVNIYLKKIEYVSRKKKQNNSQIREDNESGAH